MLARLAQYNCRLTPAARILSDVGLDSDDMAFLNSLGLLPNGWRPVIFSPVSIPGNQARLAALGLIFFNKKREISLSDAGRFLLVLASSYTAG